MDNIQIEELVKQLKAVGLDDEKIMDLFYETFKEGKMDRKDLETLANALGYELTDDFKNDETPDPIESQKLEGVSEEELEDAKTIDEGETVEEFKEETEKLGEELDVKAEDKEDEGEDKEDEEWEKAQKLFRI